MKNNFKILVLLTAGLMSNAFADTGSQCGQANASFLDLAREYQACNSVMGSDSASCNRFCSDANIIGSSGVVLPAQQYCSPEQVRQIDLNARGQGEAQGRQQGREEVLRDLQAREDFISSDYFGINADDCGQRVSQATQNLRIHAIQRCNDKAVSIKNCYVQNEKIVGSVARPPSFEGNANFKKDDNKSTEQECRKTSEADARSEALRKCQEATGSQCSVDSSKTIITYRIQAPGGLRFGRRDDRICDAKVIVEAARDLGYKCSAKISVRNQAFAN